MDQEFRRSKIYCTHEWDQIRLGFEKMPVTYQLSHVHLPFFAEKVWPDTFQK